jgi:hypothetical protein
MIEYRYTITYLEEGAEWVLHDTFKAENIISATRIAEDKVINTILRKKYVIAIKVEEIGSTI